MLGAGRDGVASALKLELSATGLRNKDIIGLSDPVVVVRTQDEQGRWYKLGQTEVIGNNLNPHWSKRISVDYQFEKVQLLRFDVYDVDAISHDGTRVTKMDFLGQLTRALADLVAAGSSQTYELSEGGSARLRSAHRSCGRFCVRVHESSQSIHRVSLFLRAEGLDRADGIFRKSDPYVKIKQVFGAGQSVSFFLYKSKYVPQNLNPKWEKMVFDVPTNGMALDEVNLELELVDFDKRSEHDPLGLVRCTLAELTGRRAPFDVINKKSRAYRKKGARYKNSGLLYVDGEPSVVEFPSHVAYLRGGCKINVMIAVDMTSVGTHPTSPSSPHYTDGVVPSMFSCALGGITDVISPFLPDDNMIHAYGFGAVHKYSRGDVSHAFPLNPSAFHTTDARVHGKDHLVDAYKACAKSVRFGDTAHFADVIGLAMERAMHPPPTQENQHYTVLVILSSGALADVESTVRKLCAASEIAPLSVVIIGAGKRRDWSVMERLDGDKHKLRTADGSVTIKRDIVDFVKYSTRDSPAQLAADVMREVPEALREYFATNHIKPNAPSAAAAA